MTTSLNRIGRDDPRYPYLASRGFNHRFKGNPETICLVRSTPQVIEAVQESVRNNRRLAVRSGGHCLEGFVADPEVQLVIDTSLMSEVTYDPDMGAFAVAAGTQLGEVYRSLFLNWGVTLPAGEHPALGIGGHIAGGAFGFLCREHGLAVDYLYAVEVVVVDANGTAKSVVATREPDDPNRDLWWAHTGGGGGNFGVVTRCWFRREGGKETNPALLLPKAPESVLVFRSAWKWEELDQSGLIRLAGNFGEWSERYSVAGSPEATLFSILFLRRRQAETIDLKGLCTAGEAAERIFDGHLAAIRNGVPASATREIEHITWLDFALNPFPELFQPGITGVSAKVKDAFLRRPFTDRQLKTIYDYLTRTDFDAPGGSVGLATYGGKVNAVAPDATASAQREAILDTSCNVGWMDPRDEAANMKWVRECYRDLFSDDGGVPVPGPVSDGALINHPDVDLADPEWNRSGVPWHALYYKENYPRLQRIKARFDPLNVFHHALSIQPIDLP